MLRTCHTLLAAFSALLFFAAVASAQEVSAGVYNSVRGIGASVSIPSGEFDASSLTLFADIYGIPSGRTKIPGVKFNYTRQFVFRTIEYENTLFSFYAGPGVSAGYVFDHENGAFSDYDKPLLMNQGFMAALSGSAGCLFTFSRRVVLDLFWTVEGGIHIRRDETLGNIDLRLYRNGLTQAWMPQLAIRAFF